MAIELSELQSLRARLAAELKELDALIAREKAYAEQSATGTGSPRPRIR